MECSPVLPIDQEVAAKERGVCMCRMRLFLQLSAKAIIEWGKPAQKKNSFSCLERFVGSAVVLDGGRTT